jgi:ribose/xylose/arabinose/galactoside ABC-type transport system permease subunit
VERSKVWIYILSGVFAAIAGFMLTGRQGSANALMGEGMELQSIAAVVIGGTNLFGGEGKVSGTVIGILVIAVIGNGLQILGVAEFWQRVVNGLIIVLVVAIDQWRRRQARLETA